MDYEHEEAFEAASVTEHDENEPVMDYTETLQFTQRLRKQIARSQTTQGIPTDKESVELLLKTLKDMDGTAINDRRNTIEEGTADSARKVADAMADFVKSNGNPFMRNEEGDAVPIPTVNPSRLPQIEHADDEMHIGTVTETQEEFNNRMEPIYRKQFDEEDDDE